MTNVELDSDGFPKLPDFRAIWSPIYFEPILYSGERITVAVVVKSQSGVHIQSVLRPAAVRTLYGVKAAGIKGITELSVDSLKAHLESGKSPTSWRPPMTGVFVGKWRDVLSTSLDMALSQAIQQTASLSSVELAMLPGSKEAQRAHELARGRWVDAVKEIVSRKNVELLPFFDKDGILVDYGQPVRFGFLGKAIIAHFGLLRPRRLAESYKDARGRLWELRKALARADFRHAGLILHLPRADDPNFEDKDIDGAKEALNELQLEANEDKVAVHPVYSAPEAADEIARIAT
jgi:hypothetical protein